MHHRIGQDHELDKVGTGNSGRNLLLAVDGERRGCCDGEGFEADFCFSGLENAAMHVENSSEMKRTQVPRSHLHLALHFDFFFTPGEFS